MVRRADQIATSQRDGQIDSRAASGRKAELRWAKRSRPIGHLAGVGALTAREQHELGSTFRFKPGASTLLAFRTAARGMAAAAQAHREVLLKYGLSEAVLEDFGRMLDEFDTAVTLGNDGRTMAPAAPNATPLSPTLSRCDRLHHVVRRPELLTVCDSSTGTLDGRPSSLHLESNTSEVQPFLMFGTPCGGAAQLPAVRTAPPQPHRTEREGAMPDKQNRTRVLLVCANPRGTDPLRTAEEDRTLRESVQLSPHRSRIEIETLNAATIDDLRRALLKSHFDIVHFSGHGTQTGLAFEDAGGRLMVPSSDALAELLSRRQVGTAILNACYSLSVGRFTSIGVDFTVASTGPLADPAAIEFTRGFYDAVGAGKDMSDAYEEGLSCARLKGYAPDVILLRRGEVYVAEGHAPEDSLTTRDAGLVHSVLVGIALDTSGSMRESIRNESGGALSRLESARQAIEKIGRSVQSNLQRSASDSERDAFRLFAYAFGLRVGGVGDLFSLVRASREINVTSEIARRRQKYEAEAGQRASGYAGLADLARRHGFGGIVDDVANAARSQAEQSIRERIVGEISGLLQRRAEEIGDSTLTADELVQVWEGAGGTTLDDVEPMIYGMTPMTAAAAAIEARFARTKAIHDGSQESALLVVSDGEPSDGDPRPRFEAMRRSGIVIISCFVTDDDVADPRVLVGTPQPSWSSGARLMFDIASPVEEKGPFARYLLGQGWAFEPEARLFVQVNHSEVLEEFVRMTGSQLSGVGVDLLPEGR